MKYYEAEKNDGLVELLKSSASIALTCQVLPNKQYNSPETEATIAKILASAPSNPDQKDLYYLNSVLVSTGWNKNDDVFDPNETWAARSTPADKQFNFMHDESDIIGHITGSVALDRDGNDVTAQDTPPEAFDIVTSAVIYTAWSDAELKDRISTLIEEIDEGKWAVSMECLFTDFDYAVITPDGTHKVIARDETSAFLTKHLRSYGGTGEYEGYALGRQLKNIVFSGKGLVDNPANPRSIILDKDINPFKSESQLSVANIKGESSMDLETLQAQNAELKSQLEKVQAEVNDAAQAEFTAKIEALESSVADKDTAIADLEKQVADLTDQAAAKDEENKALKDGLEKMKKEKKDEKRKASLIAAGLDADEVEATANKLAGIDDDAFAVFVEMLAAKTEAAEKVEVDVEAVAEETETEAEAEETAAEEAEEEAEAEVEADKDAVEEAETTEASLADAGDEVDPRGKSVAAAQEWLSSKILKSTRNLNK